MAGVAAILLAAGASRRMGTPKALLPVPPTGEPLVARVASALAGGGASPVLIVVAPGEAGKAVAAASPESVPVVNAEPGRGMLSSVQAGLRALLNLRTPPGAFLVCPCDMPGLEPAHARCVVEAYGRGGAARIIAPTFGGKRGHPTLFAASLADEILALDPTEFGLNEILKRFAAAVAEVPAPGEAVLRDADTPEEWRRLTGGYSLQEQQEDKE